MKTEMCIIRFLILFLAVSFVKSCGQNRKYYYCKHSTKIQEKLCPGVQALNCARYALRCGCDDKHHRDSNGNCVKPNQCGAVIKQKEKAQQNAIIKKQNVFNYTLQVIQGFNDFDLLLMSETTWTGMMCMCLKSSFANNNTDGALRSVYCYMPLELPTTSTGRPRTPEKRTRSNSGPRGMEKLGQKVQFTVQKSGHDTFILLTPKVNESDELLFDLEPKYEVLAAQPDCLLLKLGDNGLGKFYCMLWGVGGEHEKNDKECFDTMDKVCTKDMYDVWAHGGRCVIHDDLAKGIDTKPMPSSEEEGPQPVPGS